MISPTRMSEAVELEILGWSGCPTTSTVKEWVERVCAQSGLSAPQLAITYVETDTDAARRRFIGSPTFLHDGVDLFPEPDAHVALTCRLYRLRDGRPSPLPDPQEFAAALERLGRQRQNHVHDGTA